MSTICKLNLKRITDRRHCIQVDRFEHFSPEALKSASEVLVGKPQHHSGIKIAALTDEFSPPPPSELLLGELPPFPEEPVAAGPLPPPPDERVAPEERFALRELDELTRLERTLPLAAVTTAVVAVAKLRICFVVFDFISVPISSFTSVNASFGVFLRVEKFISVLLVMPA